MITVANSFQAMGLLPKCNFLFSHGDERPPPDVEINKHVSKPESFLGMIESSAEGTPLAGSPGSNTAVRTRRRALRAQPDQQWFGLGPRKWASKLAVNDPGWNPGEISRKSPALQGWGSNLHLRDPSRLGPPSGQSERPVHSMATPDQVPRSGERFPECCRHRPSQRRLILGDGC